MRCFYLLSEKFENNKDIMTEILVCSSVVEQITYLGVNFL